MVHMADLGGIMEIGLVEFQVVLDTVVVVQMA
jgi:hypothetical protein